MLTNHIRTSHKLYACRWVQGLKMSALTLWMSSVERWAPSKKESTASKVFCKKGDVIASTRILQ